MKLYLDPGHGGNDPGAQGNGLNEKDVTLDISLKIRSILTNDYENVEVKMSRTGDSTKSLGQRTSEANAWGADFYLAIHINSASPSARGYEDYIYNGLSDSSKTAKIQNMIHEEVIKLNGLIDRGRKKANFHVLRESNMDALLSENGFISNPEDAALMKQDSWKQKVAQGHVNGLARYFNLTRKSKPAPAPTPTQTPAPSPAPASAPSPASGQVSMYKVMVGSFKAREHADERVGVLKSIGYDAFVKTAAVSGATWYRVQIGSFSNRENAESLLAEIEKAGFTDAFIIIEKGGAGSNTGSGSNSNSGSGGGSQGGSSGSSQGGTQSGSNDNRGDGGGSNAGTQPIPSINSIMGPTLLSPEHMNQFVKTVNPDAPDLGNYYLTYGEYYGIRGDIAFAQALHETNYFRFTGAVKPGQNNFAGIGATGGDNPGAIFATPEEGVTAQFQHLFAYATTNPLPNHYPLVDPRFHLVQRGSAPTWTALNGKWAVPGATYGQSILDLYGRMIQFAVQSLESARSNLNA